MNRITLSDIAAAAHCSIMTVSRALRGEGRISPDTRSRIQAIAGQLGYTPDPALSALVSYRTELALKKDYGVIAYLTGLPRGEDWRKSQTFVDFYEGAAGRANQLGYRLEHIWLGEFKNNSQTARVLNARGVRGLIIGPLPQRRIRLSFDFSKFAPVAVGRSMVTPNIHRAVSNHFAGMQLCWRKLRHKGYRRIGLVMEDYIDQRSTFRWSSSYWLEQRWTSEHMKGAIIPICRESSDASVRKWVDAHRPDAVILPSPSSGKWLKRVADKLVNEVAQVYLDVPADDQESSGIYQNSPRIGVAAMDVLSNALNHNELGVPEQPLAMLIEGIWKEGKTAPQTNRIHAM